MTDSSITAPSPSMNVDETLEMTHRPETITEIKEPIETRKSFTVKELLQRLAELRDRDYGKVREEYLSLNFQLTEESSIPPSLRNLRRLPPKPKWTEEHETLMQDLQVIDLHWIHSKYRDVYAGTCHEGLRGHLSRLCKSDEFSEQRARKIAEIGSRNEQKSEALEIAKFHQPELALLRTEEIREKMKVFSARYEKAKVNIRARAQKDRYAKGNEESWALIWGAAEWLKLNNPAPFFQPSPKQLAEAYVALGGPEIKPASASKKLASVRKLLGEQVGTPSQNTCETVVNRPRSTSKAANR
jgi:hypothetical protein